MEVMSNLLPKSLHEFNGSFLHFLNVKQYRINLKFLKLLYLNQSHILKIRTHIKIVTSRHHID